MKFILVLFVLASGEASARTSAAISSEAPPPSVLVVRFGRDRVEAGVAGADAPDFVFTVEPSTKNYAAQAERWLAQAYESPGVPSSSTYLLIGFSGNNPQHQLQPLVKTAFSKFDAAGLAFARSSLLSLYAAGRTAGLVVLLEAGMTEISAFHEGELLPGGYAERKTSERAGLAAAIAKAVAAAPAERRAELYDNIIVAGEDSYGDDLAVELQKQLKASAPPGIPSVKVVAPPERRYSGWTGGSILGGLSTFVDLVMTRESYKALGPAAKPKF